MKTKEERANAYADDVATTEERGWMDRSDIYAIARDAHLAGAIEQKAIDDAAKENLQIEWRAMYDRLYKEKEALIDKACKWLKEHWRDYAMTDGDGMIGFIGWESDFRNAMEE